MSNINSINIANFNKPHILASQSYNMLPVSVIKRLGDKDAKDLLETIQKFENDPLNVRYKGDNYDKLMDLFTRGTNLNGSLLEKEDAFQLVNLMIDAILQNQQNTGNEKYRQKHLAQALQLQDQLFDDLEKNGGFRSLLSTGAKDPNTHINRYVREYQTEKITTYLAQNQDKFSRIFEKLNQKKSLTNDEKTLYSDLKKLAGDGENGRLVLNGILRTFEKFKKYSFGKSYNGVSIDDNATLSQQAGSSSSFERWRAISSNDDNPSSSSRSSGRSRFEDDDDDDRRSSSRSRRYSNDCCDILERILARLEKLDPDNDGVINNSSGARGSGNNRSSNRSNNRCNCANCNSCNNADNSSSNGNNGNNDIPSWARLGLNLAGQFLNITGLGNNNQNCGCYSPAPCYGGGSPSPCPPMPYYVGGNTWPWGGANGINGQYGASNNAIPSSVSSNPYSTASAYNNTPVNVNVRVNPVFNNNPYMVSNSSALSSSNAYNLRRSFGIS